MSEQTKLHVSGVKVEAPAVTSEEMERATTIATNALRDSERFRWFHAGYEEGARNQVSALSARVEELERALDEAADVIGAIRGVLRREAPGTLLNNRKYDSLSARAARAEEAARRALAPKEASK